MSPPRCDRPLCVLQVLPALDAGGVERGAVEIATALAAAGQRSIVMSAGGRLTRELGASEHVRWSIGAKRPWVLRHVPRLRRYLVEQGVDVLHARSRLPAWVAYLAWRGLPPLARPRFITTAHGFYSVSRYSAIMTRGERVIAVSETLRDFLLASFPGLAPERVVRIFRGIDPRRYRADFRPTPQWRAAWAEQQPQLAGQRVITLAGRITRLKGHRDLVALVQALRGRGIPAHGLIVGDENRRRGYARHLRTVIERENMGPHFTILGHRDDLRCIMASSDLVVSLSTQPESFGRTVLEALALGCPVVGYDHGGVGEILAAKFPPGAARAGDVGAAAEASARVLCAAHPPAIGPSPQFTLERMCARTLALYRAMARRRPEAQEATR